MFSCTHRNSSIEETWHHWQRFYSVCQTFTDWLASVESIVDEVTIDDSNFNTLRDELQNFEVIYIL